MKHICLIISFFLCSSHTAHAMEKEKEKLKPIASILQSIKTLPKKVAAPFIKKQSKTPILIVEKTHSEGHACVQAIKDNDPEQLELELSIMGADVNYISNGKSLFYIACEERATKHTNTNILEILLTHENIDLTSRNARGSIPLDVACQLGLASTVASMLKKSPAAVYYRDTHGFTPLHTAVACGKQDCIKLLLSHDTNLTGLQDYAGNTPLHIAIALRENCIEQLLSYDISNINRQNYNGDTPLHQACVRVLPEYITLLIQKGADTTIQNHNQQTAPYLLFSMFRPDNYREFLNNCDPHVRHQFVYATDHNNNTQLHLCAAIATEYPLQQHIHQSYLELLVSQNIDPTAQNSDGKTALDLAHEACTKLHDLYQMEQLPYIQQALDNQEIILIHFLMYANPSPKIKTQLQKPLFRIEATQPEISQNMTQYTDLSQAQKKCLKGVEENDLSLVKESLSEGADINFYNQKGDTLLSRACTVAKKSIIKELLEQPINLKAINTRTGDTPLHAACKAPYSDRCGRDAIVALLLAKDPDLATITSMDGTTPLDIAMRLENTDCLKNILKYNPAVASTINNKFNNETPLYAAVKNLNIKQIELLLNADKKGINHQNNKGDTVLHHACSCTSYTKEMCDIIKLLIINGADTTIKNHNKATPLVELFSDISAPEFKIVDFLLAEHPDIFEILIQTKDKNQNTQFHLCTQLQIFKDNFEQYVLLLKNNNLDIHTKNKDGRTAVNLAERRYENLYNLYTKKRSPYLKWSFATQEYIYHTFLRVTQPRISCASFKQIFDQQTTGWPEFPRELIQHIIRTYYTLNLETIVAKKYKNNKKYYDDYIENKQEIRQQLLAKPEPKLLWGTV